MSRRLAAAATVLALSLVVPALALAAADYNYRGKTEQDRPVRMNVGQEGAGAVKWVTLEWRAPCDDEIIRTTTGFGRPLQLSTAATFEDQGSYTIFFHPDYKARIFAHIEGDRVSETRWEGTFWAKAKIVRRHDGQVVNRCRRNEIDWRATERDT